MFYKEYFANVFPNIQKGVFMNFTHTTHFIYQSCITRVQQELKRKKLPQISIYRPDKTLVSTFFNYMKYIEKGTPPKNNPYLLPPCLVEHEDKHSKEPCGIVPILGMEKFEVLWGKKEQEFIQQLPSIFLNLILDISETDFRNNFPDIYLVLCDYVPFAKYSTLLNIKKCNNITLLTTFGVYDEAVSEGNMSYYLFKAVEFIFARKEFASDFKDTFLKFAEQLTSYTRLPSKLERFVENDFYDLFSRHKPSSDSLGLRVKELIEKDLVHTLELIKYSNKTSNTPSEGYMKELNRASSSYIVQLEKIQQKYFTVQ